MIVRLAFSIATAIDPEIVLIDEVLAVGDMSFQTKARERMLAMPLAGLILGLAAFGIARRGARHDHPRDRVPARH